LVVSKKGNFFVKIFSVWGSKIAFLGNSFLGKLPYLESSSHGQISKKRKFDGLYKQLKSHFGIEFPKREI